MKSIAVFVMRGRSAAVLIAASTAVLFWLFPPLLIVSGAVVALVTLRRGAAEGALLAVLAGSSAGALAGLLLGLGAMWPMVSVLLACWTPLWILAWLLRATVSLSVTLRAVALLGLLGVGGFYLVLGDPAVWWSQTLDGLRQGLTMLPSGERATLEQLLDLLRSWAPLLPGQVVSAALLFVLAGLLLGRWWQALLFNPGGFRPEFHQLRLGRPLALLALALFGAAVLSGWPALSNLVLVLGTLYSVQGIAVAHALVFKLRLSPAWLLLLYLFLVPLLSQLVMALGIADAWADFRTRVRPRPSKP
ncbi:MAG TPA: DUF2232 domain-containing protein [Candidatus Competibacter sp.]|nr:DUF2232 domain-containing protein [Candidatus Competibacteraceae bacterium]HPE72533.1 DUF2232 domain-containing protein [Candidatus Competibacter sp.]